MRFGIGLAIVIAVLFWAVLDMLPSKPLPPGCYYGSLGQAGGYVRVMRCQ